MHTRKMSKPKIFIIQKFKLNFTVHITFFVNLYDDGPSSIQPRRYIQIGQCLFIQSKFNMYNLCILITNIH